MSDGLLLTLTEDIYDAATDGTPWSVVGRALQNLLGARSAALMTGDFAQGRADLLYHADIPGEAVTSYQTHYRKVDLWTNRAAALAVRPGPARRFKVWTSGHLVPDSEFLRSEFYGDFGRRLGLRYVVGTVLPLGAAGMMPLGLHRSERDKPFSDADARLLEAVLPHLRRAFQIRYHLRASSTVTPELAALDALSTGILVVDAEMGVVVANAAAEAMAATTQTIRMASAGARGHVRTFAAAVDRCDNGRLNALVRETALSGGAGGGLRLHDPDGETILAALVTPLPERLLGSRGGHGGRVMGRALILLRRLTVPREPARVELLRSLFGLTLAEGEVACALIGGATKEAVAGRRGSKFSTVHTQVRSILAKTGAANLRDLERMLNCLQVH